MDSLCDVLVREIVSYINTSDTVVYRLTNQALRHASMYHIPNPVYIMGRIRYLIASFPYLKSLVLNQKRYYVEDDFYHLHSIQTLVLKDQYFSVKPHYFTHLTNLLSLDLRHNASAGYNDSMFPYLTNLTEFFINDNHLITDAGLSQLTKLKRLTLHSVGNISNKGLSTMTQLTYLNLYHMNDITDVSYLPLEELLMTFGSLSPRVLSKTLKILYVLGCNQFSTLEGLESLPLKKVSINYCSFSDDDFRYLKHVQHLTLYGNTYITGSGFHYLKEVTSLMMCKMPLLDIYMDVLTKKPHLTCLHIYDCNKPL
jgi:Leucine-rich repeat (LRR) protein